MISLDREEFTHRDGFVVCCAYVVFVVVVGGGSGNDLPTTSSSSFLRLHVARCILLCH